MTALDVLRRLVEWEIFMGGWDAQVWEDARRVIAGLGDRAGESLYEIPIEEALDWYNGKKSLREALHDAAFDSSDLPRAERECEDAGGDFWADRWLSVCVEGPSFVVHLKEVK